MCYYAKGYNERYIWSGRIHPEGLLAISVYPTIAWYDNRFFVQQVPPSRGAVRGAISQGSH